MTDEKTANAGLDCRVSGIRDGLLFRFACDTVLPHWQMETLASAAVLEKADALGALLSEGATVALEGISLGEKSRIELEQQLCAALQKTVCVRLLRRQALPARRETRLQFGTVRGGEQLYSDGDLTVVGDVHPGARLEAVGSIVVLGALRAFVHAGCKGDVTAKVAALHLQPTALQLANVRLEVPVRYATPMLAQLCDGCIKFTDYRAKI